MRTLIHTPTKDLSESLAFYENLNYKVLSREGPTILTDGKFLIEINPDRYARPGLKIFRDSWEDSVKELKRTTPVREIDNGYLTRDQNGVWLYLMSGESPLPFDPSPEAFGTTGNFAGLSIETNDMPASIAFWEKIGFSDHQMGSPEEGWVTYLNEDGMGMSFMAPLSCPHLFFNPSMTFFNGKDNPAIIQKVRNAGLPIAEEITCFNEEGKVDNIVLQDPGGYGIFLFND